MCVCVCGSARIVWWTGSARHHTSYMRQVTSARLVVDKGRATTLYSVKRKQNNNENEKHKKKKKEEAGMEEEKKNV